MDSNSHLPSHLLHLATLSLVTRSSPFTHARTLPLHTLSHLVADYLQLLATSAKDNAELAGRDKISVWDVAAALEEFGTGPMEELREEAQRKDEGLGEEPERIRELAHGLKDLLDPAPQKAPLARIAYDELHPIELNALADLPNLDFSSGADSPKSSDDDDLDDLPPVKVEPVEPGSPALSDSHIFIRQDDSSANLFLDAWDRDGGMDVVKPVEQSRPLEPQDDEVEIVSGSSWRDPDLIPSYVPDFLPPFPGMEREQDVPSPVRRRREREREREAAQADAWANGGQQIAAAASSGDPWLAPIPYASSMLSEMHPVTALPPLSPPPASPPLEEDDPMAATDVPRQRRRRARSISPPPNQSNSLTSYRTAFSEIGHIPTWLRPNPKRRAAASNISLSHDLSLSSSDSLFGVLHLPSVPQPTRPPGFLPDFAPPKIHPFNTALPHTISAPVPYHSPSGHLLAPSPHPRLPLALPRIRTTLSQPTSSHLELFSRLTRIGPPGPLGPKGEAMDYEYVGNTAMVQLNVEWSVRPHNARLPRSTQGGGGAEDGGAGTSGEGATGIKLKLGRGGSQSNVPSPAQTPSWNVFLGGGASPAPSAMGQGNYGSPQREGYGRGYSESLMEVVREEDTASTSTSTFLPPPPPPPQAPVAPAPQPPFVESFVPVEEQLDPVFAQMERAAAPEYADPLDEFRMVDPVLGTTTMETESMAPVMEPLTNGYDYGAPNLYGQTTAAAAATQEGMNGAEASYGGSAW